MNWKQEWKKLTLLVLVFLACFFLPTGWKRFENAVTESLHLVKWYAREHVLLCLIPAFFIAGAISVFVSQGSVMKYLGSKANKFIAYGVASVSGTMLAVCSCTILPLFSGIHRMGAGLGPATAFLYSGPAINILAIILTARILGMELGVARALGAVIFSIVIGLVMHCIYRKEEGKKARAESAMPHPEATRPLWQNALFFFVMIGILVFANWGAPNDFYFELADGTELRAAVVQEPHNENLESAYYILKPLGDKKTAEEIRILANDVAGKKPVSGIWTTLWNYKWIITSVFAGALAVLLVFWFSLPVWKVIVGALPAALLALLLPMEEMMLMIPFAAAVIGLSWATSTTEGEPEEWFNAAWSFAKQILPLLLFGVLIAGALLGRPGQEGFIPSDWVEKAVGGNSFTSNLFASVAGAFMYFATLTEVPILQGLIGAGMGKGPALALLLAGPALSLPNMLVIRSVMGTQKTIVFITLVIAMATLSGFLFGIYF